MCSRTVAVSGVCRAICTTNNATFNDDNMVSLLAPHEFRPPGEREQRDRDNRRRPERPLHPAANHERGAKGPWLARPALFAVHYHKAEAERQDRSSHEVGSERLERRRQPG